MASMALLPALRWAAAAPRSGRRFLHTPASARLAPIRAAAGFRCASSGAAQPEDNDTGVDDEATGNDPGDPGDEIALSEVRVYRRDHEEHQRIFKWGVGNTFRMQSANRYMPVHKPHPKEVCVRDSYYEPEPENPNPNVIWDELNESWDVYWYEHSKLNAKPFPVKKFGVERSKKEALAFHEHLGETGRLNEKRKMESDQDGIFFDRRLQDWVCFFHRDGHPHARGYSATKFGVDGARRLAEAKRADPINGVTYPRWAKPPIKPFRRPPVPVPQLTAPEKNKSGKQARAA